MHIKKKNDSTENVGGIFWSSAVALSASPDLSSITTSSSRWNITTRPLPMWYAVWEQNDETITSPCKRIESTDFHVSEGALSDGPHLLSGSHQTNCQELASSWSWKSGSKWQLLNHNCTCWINLLGYARNSECHRLLWTYKTLLFNVLHE